MCTFLYRTRKITKELAAYLQHNKIEIHSYNEIEQFLKQLNNTSILAEPSKTNYSVYSAIAPECTIVTGPSPVSLLKAIRNEQEISGIRSAMLKDGVALVKFLKWLETAVPTGKETEISIDKNCMNSGPPNPSTSARASTPSPAIKNTAPSFITKLHRKQTLSSSPKGSYCWIRGHSTWTEQPTLPVPLHWAN